MKIISHSSLIINEMRLQKLPIFYAYLYLFEPLKTNIRINKIQILAKFYNITLKTQNEFKAVKEAFVSIICHG